MCGNNLFWPNNVVEQAKYDGAMGNGQVGETIACASTEYHTVGQSGNVIAPVKYKVHAKCKEQSGK